MPETGLPRFFRSEHTFFLATGMSIKTWALLLLLYEHTVYHVDWHNIVLKMPRFIATKKKLGN